MEQILTQERAKSKVDKDELAAVIYRGADRYKFVMDGLAANKRAGVELDVRVYEMSRSDQYMYAQKQAHQSHVTINRNLYDEGLEAEELYTASNYHVPGSVGWVMSTNIIRNMASDEQRLEWNSKVEPGIWRTAYA